jgi:methyl-accepting chemotaxis protein
MQLRTSFTIGAVAFCALFLMVVGLGGFSIQKLRIGSPDYQSIIRDKDLVADVLPPPAYVLEAYLEATLAKAEPANAAAHKARLEQLRKDYDTRIRFWADSTLPSELKSILSDQVDPPAQLFWRAVENDLMPALARGDTAAADQAYAAVRQAYAAHRKGVDATVVASTALQADDEQNSADDAKVYMGLLGAGALALLAAIGAAVFLMTSKVFKPIDGITNVMSRLAGGDLDAASNQNARKDEIGAMARAVNVFRDNALSLESANAQSAEQRLRTESMQKATAEEQQMVVTNLAAALSRLSSGDLTSRIDAAFPDAYVQLRSDFNEAMVQLEEAMSAVLAGVHGMKGGVGEIATAADDLSRRTEQQAASLEETAAALDQITATVRKTAQGAEQANAVVVGAKTDAERSGEVVREAVAAMGEIERSAQKISQIIGVIDEIAFQTNLLALNAGVEAARAGDAGKGFAVVASEVRALAQRSADAAKEIKTLISASTQQVGQGVQLVGRTGQALDGIVDKVSEITGLVSEIAASAQEQASGLAQVNTAVNQMDQVTQQNAAMVEQSTAASANLAKEADDLVHTMARFKTSDSADRAGTRRTPERAPARPDTAAFRNRYSAPALKPTSQSQRAPQAQEDGWEEF